MFFLLVLVKESWEKSEICVKPNAENFKEEALLWIKLKQILNKFRKICGSHVPVSE
jgi:hypothetical protein